MEIGRFLTNPSTNASKYNFLVIQYLRDEIDWDTFISHIITHKVDQQKPPRVRKGPLMSNRRDNRNTRKARNFQYTQKAFAQHRKATVSKILDGTFVMDNKGLEFPDIREIEGLYVSRLEEGNTRDSSNPKLNETEHSEHYGVITPDEVKNCMSDFNRDTSAGPDNLTLADLKILTNNEIAIILTKWWRQSIPDSVKQCSTTLIPKTVDELKDPSNWRPITIGNMFIRLYAKIWDKRLRKNIQFDERQKGFVPVDGCYENIKTLQQIIKLQRRNKKEYNIVFLDLVKAFDIVSHKSIKIGLKRKGVPDQVVSTILEMYANSYTRISVGGKSTRRIKINSGVKQGCPLSPILFNLIIDELIIRLKQLQIGVKLGENLISVMAFADDLVLISEHSSHMTIAIKECQKYFEQKGLNVNAGKCGSLRVLPVKGKSSMKVITREHRWWGNLPIPSLDLEKLQKYLGIHIRHDAKIALPRSVWKTKLERIMSCYLTPIQKVQVIRQSICSIILFQLRLSDHGLEEAQKINRLIRGAVKRILHLPSWTSSDWLHHRHGANIPDLLVTTTTARKRASEKMKLPKDPISRYVTDQIDHINGDRLRHLKISDTVVAKKTVTSQREERIVRQNNSRFMVTTFASKTSRAWLWTRRGLKIGDKIRAIQALFCSLPTKVNKTRGNPDLTAKRCKCRKSIEDDAHILNSCEFNHKLIIKRHDHLVSKIAKELKREHPTAAVWIERQWRQGLQLVKPDITMINERLRYYRINLPL